MTKTRPPGPATDTARQVVQAREERLAAALRANLRKRKAVGGSADPQMDQHPKESG